MRDIQSPSWLLTGHTDIASALVATPDGAILIFGSWDYSIEHWDLETPRLRNTLPGSTDDVLALAFAPDGQTLFSAGYAP